MKTKEAQKRLFIGYIIAAIGFIIGASSNLFHPEPGNSFFFTSYFLWGTYMGMYIVYRPMQDFFSNLFLIRMNVVDLMLSYVLLKVMIMFIILTVAAIIGICGGAIYKQIQWSKIAYS